MEEFKNKKHYNVVFVLGADIAKDNDGKLVLAENDHKGTPLLSEWRLKAIKKILEEKMADKIVIVSYKQEINGEQIWRCEVMRELLKDYGVDIDLVETRKQSEGATMGNGIEIKRYLFDYGINGEECAFLTNFYHIPRTSAIFQEIGLFLRPLAAESFFISDENKIKEDYGQTKFTFFDRLINELKGMKFGEFGKN